MKKLKRMKNEKFEKLKKSKKLKNREIQKKISIMILSPYPDPNPFGGPNYNLLLGTPRY